MADSEKMKQTVAELKAKVGEARKASANPRNDAPLRALRRKLKRAQRRLAKAVPLAIDAQLQRSQRVMDGINKRLDELVKVQKKKTDSAPVHSLRKKVKSLNKKIKRLNRVKARQKPAESQPGS